MKLFSIIILVFLMCVLIGLYFSYPIFSAIRTSKEIEKNTTPFQQHPAQPNFRVLVAGDSTGVGTGAADPKFSTAGRLGADYPDAGIMNISENGLKLAELEEKLKEFTTNHPQPKYDLLLIQIGANDIVGQTSYKSIEKSIVAILDIAEKFASNTVVLTSGNVGASPVFRWPLSVYLRSRTVAVREIFLTAVQNRPSVSYVDLFRNPQDDIFLNDVERYYAIDLFHPSGDGYGVWYEEIKKEIEKIKK